MKGLILSGGKGTRLRPLTYTRAKQLLPLANKPVLFYAIESLIEAGIHEIGIIVGDTFAEIEAVVREAQSGWGNDVQITFIHQDAPLGLAHAVKTAQPFLGDDRFVMFLGDNLIGESLSERVHDFSAPGCPYTCHILLTEVEDPSQFGIAELEPEPTPVAVAEVAALDGAGAVGEVMAVVREPVGGATQPLRVRRLIEKPAQPPSNLALVGVYFFDPTIFTAADAIKPSARGELEITDAIQWLINQGHDVRAQRLTGYWIDTGKMEDILDANRQVLLTMTTAIAPTARVSENSSLTGMVIVEDGAVIENSVIRGPAIIGARTVVRNAYVGPFTSIYHDAVIETCEIEFSIVLEHSVISDVRGRIEESLIGRHAEVHTSTRKPRGHKLMLGDHSRVGILPS
ncbi:MAG TPA: sugar phosphate nucleotidyltransferase [Ktedonobacterales bacterium]|nr:sugar phosphate nucleotidyltransferase [Ktedonobacterales bacterium]